MDFKQGKIGPKPGRKNVYNLYFRTRIVMGLDAARLRGNSWYTLLAQ